MSMLSTDSFYPFLGNDPFDGFYEPSDTPLVYPHTTSSNRFYDTSPSIFEGFPFSFSQCHSMLFPEFPAQLTVAHPCAA